MKRIAIILGVLLAAGSVAQAQYGGYGLYGTGSNPNAHVVRPYVTQQGTYVQPHVQTNPNRTQLDNYSTRGNINPYTGQVGTRTPRW
jgi:hypothetical protein